MSNRISRPRVLVFAPVEDVAHGLATLFAHQGCETRRLDTLENLTTEALAFAPDLILLDIELHGARAKRAAGRLRRATRVVHAWLVALGAGDRLRDIEQAENAGFDECLSKPLTPAALGDLVSEARTTCRRRVAHQTLTSPTGADAVWAMTD